MSADRNRSFWSDEGGAVMIEMTVTMFLFIVVLFGVVEFSYAYYQWNAATKSTQLGARIAAVSDPIASGFRAITDGSGTNPGAALPSDAYDVTCSGAMADCTCTGSLCPDSLPYLSLNMKKLVFGREATDTTLSCPDPNTLLSSDNIGMCHVFTRVAPANVTVRYQYTSLGYEGRPGGPVPTVTVSLTGMSFQFILLSFLLNSITMPSFATTVTGEDLNVAGSG